MRSVSLISYIYCTKYALKYACNVKATEYVIADVFRLQLELLYIVSIRLPLSINDACFNVVT